MRDRDTFFLFFIATPPHTSQFQRKRSTGKRHFTRARSKTKTNEITLCDTKKRKTTTYYSQLDKKMTDTSSLSLHNQRAIRLIRGTENYEKAIEENSGLLSRDVLMELHGVVAVLWLRARHTAELDVDEAQTYLSFFEEKHLISDAMLAESIAHMDNNIGKCHEYSPAGIQKFVDSLTQPLTDAQMWRLEEGALNRIYEDINDPGGERTTDIASSASEFLP